MAKLPLKKKKITKDSKETHLGLLWNFPLTKSGREALGQFGRKLGHSLILSNEERRWGDPQSPVR